MFPLFLSKRAVAGVVATAALLQLATQAQAQPVSDPPKTPGEGVVVVQPGDQPGTTPEPAVPDDEYAMPVCGQALTLVLHVPHESKAGADEVVGELTGDRELHGKTLCAQPGPIPDAWIFDGSPSSMLVGVIPMGMTHDLYVQRYSPFKVVGPVEVSVVDNQVDNR